jgi:hypothetical protein
MICPALAGMMLSAAFDRLRDKLAPCRILTLGMKTCKALLIEYLSPEQASLLQRQLPRTTQTRPQILTRSALQTDDISTLLI